VADLYALDTNVYITALRDPYRLSQLKRFRVRAATRMRLSAVVALELRAGAISGAHEEAFDALIRPYVDREQVIVPSLDAYLQAGRVFSALATKERLRLADAPRSFVNDVLIAVSCREASCVLVTENARDFTAIQRHLAGFRFETELSA
jgi:predicted nucleic acid-binding protein